MVRQSGGGAPTPDTTAIDLTRMLDRLQKTLVTPDSATETKLRASSYEREKVGVVGRATLYTESLLIIAESRACAVSLTTTRARYATTKDPIQKTRNTNRSHQETRNTTDAGRALA
jgi:hypothetical protein